MQQSYSSSSFSSTQNDGETEELSQDVKDRLLLREKLHQKLLEVIETRTFYPIIKEYKNRNCTIRRRVMNDNEGIDLFILERFDTGVTPEVFCALQERIHDFCKANRMVKHVDLI